MEGEEAGKYESHGIYTHGHVCFPHGLCLCLTWIYEGWHQSVWEYAWDPQLPRKEWVKSPTDLGFWKAVRLT